MVTTQDKATLSNVKGDTSVSSDQKNLQPRQQMVSLEVDLPIEVQILQNQCEGQEKEVGACERDSASR